MNRVESSLVICLVYHQRKYINSIICSSERDDIIPIYKRLLFIHFDSILISKATQILLSIIKEMPKGKLVLRFDEVLAIEQTTVHQVLILLWKFSIEVEWIYLFDLLTSTSSAI